MAAKSAAAAPLKDQSFAFSGTLQHCRREDAAAAIEHAGGTVASTVTSQLNYLVLGATRGGGTSAAETKARQLNAKGAAIQILDEADLYQLLAPSADVVRGLLKNRKRGVPEWIKHWGGSSIPFTVDLSGEDFQGADLSNVPLEKVCLDRCDFRNAKLHAVRIGEITEANFEGADLSHIHIQRAIRCNFQNANVEHGTVWKAPGCNFDGAALSHGSISELVDGSARDADFSQVRFNPADFTNADLTGANLTEIFAAYTTAPRACFNGANLTKAGLEYSRLAGASFVQANLTAAELHDCDLTSADFTGANFEDADLSRSQFKGANLTKARFAGARANDCDFTGCNLEGADFTGANILGSTFDPGADALAIRLDLTVRTAAGTAGPEVAALASAAQQARRLEVRAHVDLPNGESVLLSVQCWTYNSRTSCGGYETHYDSKGSSRGYPANGNTVSAVMQGLANRWGHGTLDFDKVEVHATKSSMKPKELRAIAMAAWGEVFGVAPPTEEELQSRQKQKKASQNELREIGLAELRGGKKGIKAWNDRPESERKSVKQFRREDFTGLDLTKVNLSQLDLQGAKFDNAKLQSALFGNVDAKGASFNNVQADKAWFAGAKLSDAQFQNANLTDCNLRNATFLRTNFQGANLTGVELFYSDIRGANFTDAKFSDEPFKRTKFDEQTQFPSGYQLSEELIWAGTGTDPRLRQKVAELQPTGPLDLDTFLKIVEENTDASRFGNAMRMLKADRFRLFAESDEASVTGVVKSQSDPDLVYACRLDSGGEFTCCTQNLNVCGGLRGALCKHLLVLLIGLTKGSTLDPTTVHAWMSASRLQKPKLDKDRMSGVFLKYKGAEAGEIDWRPTETVPEDFYAY